MRYIPITRREFLYTSFSFSSFLCFSILFPGIAAGKDCQLSTQTTSSKNIINVISQYKGLEKNYFGKRYLELNGPLNDPETVFEKFKNIKSCNDGNAMIEKKINDEYFNDQLYFVDGWLFSPTEIKVHALRHANSD